MGKQSLTVPVQFPSYDIGYVETYHPIPLTAPKHYSFPRDSPMIFSSKISIYIFQYGVKYPVNNFKYLKSLYRR